MALSSRGERNAQRREANIEALPKVRFGHPDAPEEHWNML